jgi:hypothetical protein
MNDDFGGKWKSTTLARAQISCPISFPADNPFPGSYPDLQAHHKTYRELSALDSFDLLLRSQQVLKMASRFRFLHTLHKTPNAQDPLRILTSAHNRVVLLLDKVGQRMREQKPKSHLLNWKMSLRSVRHKELHK